MIYNLVNGDDIPSYNSEATTLYGQTNMAMHFFRKLTGQIIYEWAMFHSYVSWLEDNWLWTTNVT